MHHGAIASPPIRHTARSTDAVAPAQLLQQPSPLPPPKASTQTGPTPLDQLGPSPLTRFRAALHVEHRAALDKMWTSFDIHRNGYIALTDCYHGVLGAMVHMYGRGEGHLLYMRYYHAYIRSFNDAKDAAPPRVDKDDDYVTQAEFPLLLMYLGLYATWYEVFKTIHGGSEGASGGSDLRIAREAWVAALPQVRQAGETWANSRALRNAKPEDFDEIDRGRVGFLQLKEFCEWVEDVERLGDTQQGQLPAVTEAVAAPPSHSPSQPHAAATSGVRPTIAASPSNEAVTLPSCVAAATEEPSGTEDEAPAMIPDLPVPLGPRSAALIAESTANTSAAIDLVTACRSWCGQELEAPSAPPPSAAERPDASAAIATAAAAAAAAATPAAVAAALNALLATLTPAASVPETNGVAVALEQGESTTLVPVAAPDVASSHARAADVASTAAPASSARSAPGSGLAAALPSARSASAVSSTAILVPSASGSGPAGWCQSRRDKRLPPPSADKQPWRPPGRREPLRDVFLVDDPGPVVYAPEVPRRTSGAIIYAAAEMPPPPELRAKHVPTVPARRRIPRELIDNPETYFRIEYTRRPARDALFIG